MPIAQRGSRTIGWWYAGVAIDLLHMPVVIVFVLLGATVFSGTIYATLVTVLVVAQIAVMGCPVMALTASMKRKHDPEFEGHWSFTYWLYQRYGPVVGIAVFVVFLGLGLGLRQLW